MTEPSSAGFLFLWWYEMGIGRTFSGVRDKVGITAEDNRELPTFYEQRSLSGRLYKEHGIDVQMLWGHKTAKMSELYLEDRSDEWQVIAL
ncbi:hypothetical protein [[Enterobacter] lignolyticus]|uniref:hypothetical protein n=1 Tax=[Enterobacter] lignolyticus TaxID=1334193 RepID=UPI0002EC4DFB|nr:hypothetical protein [[Enterobacter] lignolyticus]